MRKLLLLVLVALGLAGGVTATVCFTAAPALACEGC
jgi:hypothetical protein